MVDKKADTEDTPYLTYGLIAGGVIVAGAALWYFSGEDPNMNKLNYDSVHTVELLREILDEHALECAETIVFSYNMMLKHKENQWWEENQMPAKICANEKAMSEKLLKMLKTRKSILGKQPKSPWLNSLGQMNEEGFKKWCLHFKGKKQKADPIVKNQKTFDVNVRPYYQFLGKSKHQRSGLRRRGSQRPYSLTTHGTYSQILRFGPPLAQ